MNGRIFFFAAPAGKAAGNRPGKQLVRTENSWKAARKQLGNGWEAAEKRLGNDRKTAGKRPMNNPKTAAGHVRQSPAAACL